jgi:ribosomal protein S18 acetylase RimI-like enzyme
VVVRNEENSTVSFENEVRLTRVNPSEIEALKNYVAELYKHDNDYECMVNIGDGVTSLLRNENLATPYFITRGVERIGYVILTKYHSVEKGGLTMYIDELYVEEELRRKGVGKQILSRILEIARGAGAKHLWVQAEPYNDAAAKFFESQGFHKNPNINFEMPL